MIAWENRDVDAQQEFVDKLRTELQQATPEDRDAREEPVPAHPDSRRHQEGARCADGAKKGP